MSKITQLVKGSACNAKCPMCLSLANDYGCVSSQLNLLEFSATPDYWQQLATALNTTYDLGSREVVITSYGDPLDRRNRPNLLTREIVLARQIGFPQVTLITNGFGLDETLCNELYTSGLTHLTLSIHATNSVDYAKFTGTGASLAYTLFLSKYAQDVGLVVRHNYVWHRGLTLESVLEQTQQAGAEQVTLLEIVPNNKFARQEKIDLPPVPSQAVLLKEFTWGMSIYKIGDQTIAWCHFGQNDPSFDQQEKNYYINILNNGEIRLRYGSYFNLNEGLIGVYKK